MDTLKELAFISVHVCKWSLKMWPITAISVECVNIMASLKYLNLSYKENMCIPWSNNSSLHGNGHISSTSVSLLSCKFHKYKTGLSEHNTDCYVAHGAIY